MRLPLSPPFPLMEAATVADLPQGEDWIYEPKWDGFRCLVFKDGAEVYLQSKAGKPLGRYFPDVVKAVAAVSAPAFILDGEIVIPVGRRFSFDDLLLRIHPAKSRVEMLAKEHPARLIVFDILAESAAKSMVEASLAKRRERLERFFQAHLEDQEAFRLSPHSGSAAEAKRWLKEAGGNRDGVMAKRAGLAYQSGKRTGMVKIKRLRTADCVVGGFRYASSGGTAGSLLLGLYDGGGLLHHVGFTSALSAAERKKLTPELERLRKPPGFTGRAPGGPSRWSTERTGEWEPLDPKLVVEVQYDHFTGGRFRHGTRLLRFRPDKAPHQCTMDQVQD